MRAFALSRPPARRYVNLYTSGIATLAMGYGPRSYFSGHSRVVDCTADALGQTDRGTVTAERLTIGSDCGRALPHVQCSAT
jgi:hypothetical protein